MLPSKEAKLRELKKVLKKAGPKNPLTTKVLARKFGVAFTTMQRWIFIVQPAFTRVREGERGPESLGYFL